MWMTLDEVAEQLGVSTRTIRLWEKLGRLHPDHFEKRMRFHHLEVERLQKCINGELKLSRRPAEVFFDSLRKPPQKIQWAGILGADEDAELYQYVWCSDTEAQHLIEISVTNGWFRHGFLEIELADPDGREHMVEIDGKSLMLPGEVVIGYGVTQKVTPVLTADYLYIHPDYTRLDEFQDFINACPSFIIFHFYEVIGSNIKHVRQILKGEPIWTAEHSHELNVRHRLL